MFLRIGHRGAPGNPRYGENTMTSFFRAVDKCGANALEFDVRKTKDNRLVVIHDLSISRTTNGIGNVCDYAYKELTYFDAGHGNRIPRLEEVLAMFGRKCVINIEIKEQGLAEPVGKLISRKELCGRVIVSAFDEDDNDSDSSSSWHELASLRPKIQIALLATKNKILRIGEARYVAAAVEHGAMAINPEYTAAAHSLIDLAHRNGRDVFAWTVNNPRDITKLKAMGVDGIFSDFPERL